MEDMQAEYNAEEPETLTLTSARVPHQPALLSGFWF